MPFDPEGYGRRCVEMSDEVLLDRRSHYIRQRASNSTGAALHTAAGGFTSGLTWLLVPYDAARISNARRKRRILDEHAVSRVPAIKTKRGGVLIPTALGLGLGGVAFEIAGMCAELLVEGEGPSGSTTIQSIVKGAAHLGLDVGIAGAERVHAKKEKMKTVEKPK